MPDTRDESFTRQPDTEPIPGYRLIAPLGRGGFGEVWKCEAPGGLLKAIKFVHGNTYSLDQSAPADEELRAVNRVKTIRHPFILSMERVEVVDGELVIVSELADRSLADVLAAVRSAGKPGLARDALLAYLREAAEALDVMHVRHGLQHLDVKPQNLFLVSDHVKVGDFGLVQSVSGNTNDVALGAITPLYASPEVFQGRISTHSDQYSLAIVYQELLTGTLPFAGKNARQLMMQHVQGEPDLEPLPESDRPIVARALAKDPAARFRTCSDLVTALATGQAESGTTVVDLPLRAAPPEEDTRRTPSVKTTRTRTVSALRPPLTAGETDELEITELVSRTPQSETWNARTCGGEARLVKVLFARADASAAERLVALRHPALSPMEVIQNAPGKLVLSMPAGDRTLRDVYADLHAQGHAGVPRGQLLRWLREAAGALADLAQSESLYHLSLNPRSLVLHGERLAITDFGVSQLVWLPTGQSLAAVNARYSAPELLAREIGPACDQYSLALIYHELMTGVLPAPVAGRKNELSVERLPEGDRAAVARALHPDPKKRWPSTAELILALVLAGGVEPEAPPVTARPMPTMCTTEAPTAVVQGGAMQARLGTNLTPEAIRKRLDSFGQQWGARLLAEQGTSLAYQVQTPRNLWQRWTCRQPGLEIDLVIGRPEIDAPVGVQVRTEVLLTFRARECSSDQSRELLEAVGPLLVDSVRQHLRASPLGRQQERVLWPYPLQVCPVLAGGGVGPPIECQGKDVSLNGIGFYMPGQLPASHLHLRLPRTAQTAEATVQARVVRVQGCGDGWYEVGAVLLPANELRPEDDEAGAA